MNGHTTKAEQVQRWRESCLVDDVWELDEWFSAAPEGALGWAHCTRMVTGGIVAPAAGDFVLTTIGYPAAIDHLEGLQARRWADLGEGGDSGIEDRFRELADRWYADTLVSSVHDMVLHPAYQQIIGMGREVLPLILTELRDRGGHWFWALCAIAGEDIAPRGADFDSSVAAWLTWGGKHGLL